MCVTIRVSYLLQELRWQEHYNDVIMTTMASQITSLTVVYSTVYSDADQENTKAPRHWPLCGEFTGTGEFPAQRASYAEMFPFDDVIMKKRHTNSTVPFGRYHGYTSSNYGDIYPNSSIRILQVIAHYKGWIIDFDTSLKEGLDKYMYIHFSP